MGAVGGREREREGAVGVREAAGVIISPRGRPCKKKTVQKIFFAEVLQCRKPTQSTQHYLYTLPKTCPTLIHRGEDPSGLSDAIPYLNT